MWRLLIVSLLLLGGCKSMSFKPLLPATLGVVGGGIGALGGNPVTAGLGAGLGAGAGTLLVQGSDKVESEVRVLKALTTGDVNKVVEAKLDEAKDNGFFDGVSNRGLRSNKTLRHRSWTLDFSSHDLHSLAFQKTKRKMEEGNIIFSALQVVSGVLFAVGGFVIKGLFNRMDTYGKRINKLEVDMARNTSENETLFKRLDGIEDKLDRLLEWRRNN